VVRRASVWQPVPVHTLIVWTAQYLLFVMAAVFVLVWLIAEDRNGKVVLAATAALGVVLMVAFLYIAKDVHHDPRPFVQNPRIKPLFGHSRDDGFPSDHSIAAALIAVLVFWRHRVIGVLLGLAAAAIAWARVAAHVHHLQDVLAGLALGALAAVIAGLVVPPVVASISNRRTRVS
jgi:membrane-associated phospholipid phosphatase